MNYEWTLEDPEPVVRVYCAGLPISAAQVGDDEVVLNVGHHAMHMRVSDSWDLQQAITRARLAWGES